MTSEQGCAVPSNVCFGVHCAFVAFKTNELAHNGNSKWMPPLIPVGKYLFRSCCAVERARTSIEWRLNNKVDDFMEMFLIRRISMSIPDFEIGGLQLRCAVIGY